MRESMQPLFAYDSMSRMMQDNHRRGMHQKHQGSLAQHRPVRFSIPVCCPGCRDCPGSPGRHLHVHHHCHHIQVEEGEACCLHTLSSQCLGRLLRSALLYWAMLCCAVLRFAGLLCAAVAVWCHVLFLCAVVRYAVLRCAVLLHLHCAAPFCNAMCCAVLCCAVLCCAPDAVLLMLNTQNSACHTHPSESIPHFPVNAGQEGRQAEEAQLQADAAAVS